MKKLILIFTMVIFILPIKGQEKIDTIKIDCNCMQEDTLISFNLNGNWHIQIVPIKNKYKSMGEKILIYNNEIKDKNDHINSYDVFSILRNNPKLIDDFIKSESTKKKYKIR